MLAQSTILSSVDDTNDPLGPLGAPEPAPATAAPVEQAPTPPKKEPGARQVSTARPPSAAGDDGDNLSIRSRGTAPVQAPSATFRPSQPSVSVEQAAKPTFDISVGDPHKVGDLTSSHIVYQVRTKVSAC